MIDDPPTWEEKFYNFLDESQESGVTKKNARDRVRRKSMKEKKHDGWCLLTPRGLQPNLFSVSKQKAWWNVANTKFRGKTEWEQPETTWVRLKKKGYKLVPVKLSVVKG